MLLNDKIVLDMARSFAGRVLESACCPSKVIEHAYLLALGRSPTTQEMAVMREFLNKQRQLCREREQAKKPLLTPLPADEEVPPTFAAAVVDLCHAILNLNEFLFVD
jgi:hypothetical protein